MLKSQDIMRANANKRRRDIEYAVGDWVFLKMQPYRRRSLAKRINEKLSPRFYGPFQVLNNVVVVAYKLDLPSHSKIHSVFHVSLLKKAIGDSFQSQPLPPMLSKDQELQAYPNSVLDICELPPGIVKVLIQWKNLPPSENSWESVAKLQEVFPTYHLEDKVSLLGGGIDKHKHKPHITKVYTRKQRAREAITMDHQQQGAQHPRDANHPKGARSEDVNQGDMTLGNNHNQPL